MILLVLLLAAAGRGQAYSVRGQEINGACVCEMNSTLWAFPTAKYGVVTNLLQNCKGSLQQFYSQTETSVKKVTVMDVTLKNVQQRLEKYQYLKTKDVYDVTHLKQLSEEIQQLQGTMGNIQTEEAQRIRTELQKFQEDVDSVYKKNVFNLEKLREKFRYLNNRVQTCRTIPQDFRSSCSQRMMSNVSAPIVVKANPFSTSYIAGAWGHDIYNDTEEKYWIQPLFHNHMLGNTMRFYQTYEDFMAGRNYKDETLVNSYTHVNAIQGPGTIVYKGVVYYECYNKPDICAYDVKTKQVRRLAIPDAGFNNKFPYCYYNCFAWTDINLSVDSQGLWVIYATEANHGNIVVSRVDFEDFNVTHTWKTRLFKRSVTNAFMVCGVLYATRFENTYREEVFYAFDTTTGAEDNTLSLPIEKVTAGVASLHYNPIDTKLYMYNSGYMLAYQAYF